MRRTRNGENSVKSKLKMGRPTKWQDDFLRQATVATSELGATNTDLAKLFNISIGTIDNWIANKKDFFRAISKGREKYDNVKVKAKLLMRAMGFEYDEKEVTQTVMKVKKDNGNGKTIRVPVPAEKIKITTKYVVPDVNAIRYWLNNRDRKNWSDRQHHVVEGQVTHGVLVAHKVLGVDEWAKAANNYRDSLESVIHTPVKNGEDDNEYNVRRT